MTLVEDNGDLTYQGGQVDRIRQKTDEVSEQSEFFFLKGLAEYMDPRNINLSEIEKFKQDIEHRAKSIQGVSNIIKPLEKYTKWKILPEIAKHFTLSQEDFAANTKDFTYNLIQKLVGDDLKKKPKERLFKFKEINGLISDINTLRDSTLNSEVSRLIKLIEEQKELINYVPIDENEAKDYCERLGLLPNPDTSLSIISTIEKDILLRRLLNSGIRTLALQDQRFRFECSDTTMRVDSIAIVGDQSPITGKISTPEIVHQEGMYVEAGIPIYRILLMNYLRRLESLEKIDKQGKRIAGKIQTSQRISIRPLSNKQKAAQRLAGGFNPYQGISTSLRVWKRGMRDIAPTIRRSRNSEIIREESTPREE